MQLPDLQDILRRFPALSNLAPLARGGQKVVFAATHTTYGNVVLKLILDPSADERVRREIDIARNCSFTNVPELYEWGEIPNAGGTVVYLVERYVTGETLSARLQRAGKLPLQQALDLIESLLVAAVEIEEQQLVHRDIKPLNIMIDGDGRYWLLDFGIARHLGKTSITATGAHFGPHSAGYAAPEQVRNVKANIDIRADLFSIGVVAYEAITGEQPFIIGARDHLDVLRRTDALTPATVNVAGDSQKQLAGFIALLMDKFPSRRPRTAQLALDWFRTLRPTIIVAKPGE